MRGVLILVLTATATALLGLLPGPAALLIAAAMLAGAARGVFTLLQATAISDRWGATHYGRLNGLLSAPALLATAPRPGPAPPSPRPSAATHPCSRSSPGWPRSARSSSPARPRPPDLDPGGIFVHIHTSPRRARTARTAVAALIAAAACWGIGTVVSKQVVDDVAPLTLLPVQLAVSCAFLLVVALVRREPLTWTPPVRRLAALGVLNPGIAYALGLIGLTTITASMSVLLWALEPVVILLLAALVLRERIPPALAVTVAVAISGALLVVYQPGASGDAVGITLTLVSIGFCALYTVLTRRLMLDDSSLTVVLAQQAAALVFAVALASVVELAGGPGWDLAGLSAGAWLGAAVSGILYYGLGFFFYVAGLRHLPASYAGAFLPLIPVFGVAAGYLVGERLEPRQWLGAVVIVAATAVIAARHRGCVLVTGPSSEETTATHRDEGESS